MKRFDQQVADWARTKPADERYDNLSNCNCAVAQFLKATGQASDPQVGGYVWRDGDDGQDHPYTKEFADLIHAEPRTFGALADRLSA